MGSSGGSSGSALTPTANAKVTTSEATTSASFTDLSTAGPAAAYTVPASGKVKVTLSALIEAGAGTSAWMGVDLSGANTVAANQNEAMGSPLAAKVKASSVFILTGLTPGATTFTAKYRVDDGTSSSSFSQRRIIVEDVPT